MPLPTLHPDSPPLRRFFDPRRYRVICVDQRGAGESRPRSSTQRNTTADLLSDPRLLRRQFSLTHSGGGRRMASAWGRSAAAATPAPPESAALTALVDRYRVQSHYLANDCWLTAPPLLERLTRLPQVPTLLLHADADRICRPAGAAVLQQRVPHSRLRWVAGAGHDPAHPAMASAMRAALDSYAERGDFDGVTP